MTLHKYPQLALEDMVPLDENAWHITDMFQSYHRDTAGGITSRKEKFILCIMMVPFDDIAKDYW